MISSVYFIVVEKNHSPLPPSSNTMFSFSSLRFFFKIWTIFKVFTEFVNSIGSVLCFDREAMWDLCSLTTGQSCTPCIERHSPKHWTVREIPAFPFI